MEFRENLNALVDKKTLLGWWSRLTLRSIILALILAGCTVGLFFILRAIFSGAIILPQSFAFAGLTVRFYGICIALAVLAAYWLAMHRRERYGISPAEADSLLLILMASGFVGARLYHVFSEFSFYVQHPQLIPAVWQGGLSIFGALLGGVIALVAYIVFTKSPRRSEVRWHILNILDWLVPSFVLGQIIGRFGNLFNYEAYGMPTDLAWKMFVPSQFRLAPFESFSHFHPLFLYEAAANTGVFVVLYFVGKYGKDKLPAGKLFFLWLFLYNGVRFFLEGLRVDSVLVSEIRLNVVVSGILALIGVLGYQYFYEQQKPSHL